LDAAAFTLGLRAIPRLCGMVGRRRAYGLGAGSWEEKAVAGPC